MPLDAASLPSLPFTLGTAPAIELAPWHADRPHLVASALVAANAVAPHLAPLARLVLPRAPRRTLATSTLKTASAGSFAMLLDEAIAQTHIGIRTTTHAYAVVVDCDHADWPELLADLAGHGLPRPTWITADPWTGRAHLVWWLRDAVVLTERGREAPRRLLEAVAGLLTSALCGDQAYTGTLTKNPWAPGPAFTRSGVPAMPALWDAHRATAPGLRHAVIPQPALHDLRVLRRALLAWQEATGSPSPGRRRRPAEAPDSERGRRLFDALRYRVYAAWPTSEARVQETAAETAASLGSPISPRQLAGMARRMHSWCSRHYTARRTASGADINRGRDRLETAGLELREAQRIAAINTNTARRRDTGAALREAAARLVAAGTALTRATLAAAAGISERTVQRHWQAIPGGDTRCPSGVAALVAAPRAAGSVHGKPVIESLGCPSLAGVAQADRAVRHIVSRLERVVAAAVRKDVVPPSLPEVPAAVARAPAIRDALRRARAAVDDAARRAAARVARERSADRFSDMKRRLDEDPRAAWRWWREHLAAMDDHFDKLEGEADPRSRARVQATREATIGGRWRQWRRAAREAVREPDLAAIPW